ncbi:LytTR family DNA-binding domain-containing protein [Metabacillus litoralis]|uniref:LytR/AlgR family response regulator transcription factor n=1 Tax=Metabacillus TaxID=2675233 RepID=UPI000EF596C1|nr:LytTR family DNA-binding domain-containing protein [Metabacillus litoralis]MCM3160311.1 LytTR family DNA-binding domain-containing protein [Metabacillus litoralis]
MKKRQIKILIVDDERYSRDELKHLLSEHDIIHVVGEADSGESALVKTLQLKPDVVFLDIEMPKMNGMETAMAMKELKHQPLLVFATAYPSFAVDAFRYDAIDYVLKPFEEERLQETIGRLEDRLVNIIPQQEEFPSKLAVESDEGIVYIHPDDILYLYRDERVTKIVGSVFKYETKTPLKDLEIRLKDFSFFRIHKSYLVNLKYVTKLIPWFNGAYQLELKGYSEQLSVSRNYVKALRERLEI